MRQSTRTGLAPAYEMASAVAMNVLATVITSSPAPMPRARRIRWRASVPEPTPTACGTWQNSAHCALKDGHLRAQG